MLIQFNFKNYKSFRDEVSLDFSATKITEHESHVVEIANDKLLKVAAIYGANASGKSNVYDAFDYTKACGFLIGNEGNGLSKEIADCADTYIRIPMEGKVESLNAAISATLLMYECNRQRRKK